MSKLNLRRFFALLLALVMVLSIGATPVFANEIGLSQELKAQIDEVAIGAPYFFYEDNMDSYNKAAKLSNEIVGSETDAYKKAKLIYQWMARNIKYDTERLSSLTSRDEFYYEQGYIYESGYTGICGDFAKLFQELCWTQNIPCVIFNGRVKVGNGEAGHIWNAFYANNAWHWVDPTPNAPQPFDTSDSTFNQYYRVGGCADYTNHHDWAHPWLMSAMQNGLMDIGFIDEITPKYGIDTRIAGAYNNLRESCSRLQFAQLAVNLLEEYYDKNIDEILADKGVVINEAMFTDTTDKDVLTANALGIVSGYGDGIYNPDGELKRQEAAAILYRTAKVMGLEMEGADLSVFTDLDSIGTWAREAVAFCKAAGVMSGTSETTFDAQSAYTREQCVVTIVRLFDAVN